MRRLALPVFGLFLSLVFVASLPSEATAAALFSGPIETGGFGAFAVRGAELGEETEGFLGGRGGWIFNHSFAVGGGAYMLFTTVPFDTDEGERRIKLTQINLEFEYIFASEAVLHPTLALNAGLGRLKLSDPNRGVDDRDPDPDTVTLVEPMVRLVVNVTESVRVGFGAGYRWISGVDLEEFDDADGEGYVFEMSTMVGKF